MNRKQRRDALKHRSSAGGLRGHPAGDAASQLFAEAVGHQQQNRLTDAARAYKRLLLLKPDHAQASNNLGLVLQAQGKLHEASARFARALMLMPQLFDQSQGICATLVAVLPPLGEAIRNTIAAWPQRLPADRLLGSAGLAAIASDPLLLCLLQAVPVRDVALERTLTSLRAALFAEAGDSQDDSVLAFCCALAKQCFINEYVFATTADEDAQVERRKAALGDAIAAGADISPMQLAALAMYWPLHALPNAETLLAGAWPPAFADLLTQQLREPLQERALCASIARLTAIDDEVSLRVQQQYEQNPYPRWVHAAGQVVPTTIDQYLYDMFPTALVTPLTATDAMEVLVAGCGTGWHAVEFAQKFAGARVLAVDLSMSSLSYAKRNTPAALAGRIDYAQADILKLGSLGRSFDVIDASGVLHHMADPAQGWRILLSLLRPCGLMHLGFYSELGRRDVVAARALIAERGYGSTAAEIRRCRQDLLETPLRRVARFSDFFSSSECRDMLFHVQEGRLTIPAIKSFLAEQGLRFLGFEFDAAASQKYRALFANAGWSMTDLDRWHALETSYPDTFSSMYQLWAQKG
jgi:2-polyprenyl-3-methyl-5-hydroxy-6-metoxy-1,4-benzoquinol methylase